MHWIGWLMDLIISLKYYEYFRCEFAAGIIKSGVNMGQPFGIGVKTNSALMVLLSV